MHPREFMKKWGIEREDFVLLFPDKPSTTVNGWLGSRCPASVREQMDIIDALFLALEGINERTPQVFRAYLNSIEKRHVSKIRRENDS